MPEIPTSPQRASEALLLQVDGVSNIHAERGSRQRQWSFGPYGQLPPQGAVGGLRFVGQWFDPVVQGYLLGNGHRLYSPSVMRFLSSDSLSPFGAGGINAYAYCAGDPVNYHDPSGRAKYGLTKLLIDLKLPKAPLRDYLKALGRPGTPPGQKRLVYRLKDDQFEVYEFTGWFKKVHGKKQAATIWAVGESFKDNDYYIHGDLYIKKSTVPKEGVKHLEKAGFILKPFDISALTEAVYKPGARAPAEALTRYNLHSPDNLYIEDPDMEVANVRGTGPN